MSRSRKRETLLSLSEEGDFKEFVRRHPGLTEEELRRWIAEAALRLDSDERPTPVSAQELLIYVDGASRGNPGPAGAGAIFLTPQGSKLTELSMPLGKTTNNVAEYMSLMLSLEKAAAMGARRVSVRTDSELLTLQVNGRYRVRKPHLIALHREVKKRTKWFDSFEIEHVPRGQNREADRLANLAIGKMPQDRKQDQP